MSKYMLFSVILVFCLQPSNFLLDRYLMLKAFLFMPSAWFQPGKRLHDSILSIISVSSTFASLNLNR